MNDVDASRAREPVTQTRRGAYQISRNAPPSQRQNQRVDAADNFGRFLVHVRAPGSTGATRALRHNNAAKKKGHSSRTSLLIRFASVWFGLFQYSGLQPPGNGGRLDSARFQLRNASKLSDDSRLNLASDRFALV